MKSHPYLAAACLLLLLLLLFVSSCKDAEKEISVAPDPKPVPEAQSPMEKDVAPPKSQEQPVPSSTAPAISVEKSNDTLTDLQKLEAKFYYNEENLAEANGLIEKMSAEVKEQILTEMKARRKVAAVKIVRAEAETSLAVSKMTVELLAIRANVSAGL